MTGPGWVFDPFRAGSVAFPAGIRAMRSILFTVLLLFIMVSPVFAREVRVLVRDAELDLSLPGAQIRLSDGRMYVFDDDGMAVFSVPPDARMLARVTYPGYDAEMLTITPGNDSYEVALRLSGMMEGRELVILAARPDAGRTEIGRSVAVTGREISGTAEIGIVEDVMATVRLLPGVSYTGLFNAQPSIRGGEPGDMRAVLDGFYVLNPFHWGGGFSIFDPRMVGSVQLSHGVFSVRHGHTISGLLDIRTRNPSGTDVELDVGASSSAANFAVSLPLGGRGGVLFMGRITYYDPVVALAQGLSGFYRALDVANTVNVTPYIRSGTVTGSYRLSHSLEIGATAFLGMDGGGVVTESFDSIDNPLIAGFVGSSTRAMLDYTNSQAFATGRLSWNPRGDMLLRFVAGLGRMETGIDGELGTEIDARAFSPDFMNTWGFLEGLGGFSFVPHPHSAMDFIRESRSMLSVQGRMDFDWELGGGFLVAAGVQETIGSFRHSGIRQVSREVPLGRFSPEDRDAILDSMGVGHELPPVLRALLERYLMVSSPVVDATDVANTIFATSGYALAEYRSPGGRLGAELGVRLDHHMVSGADFSISTPVTVNPRILAEVAYPLDGAFLESVTFAAGTGLFSSMSDSTLESALGHDATGLRSARSWTSVVGTVLEFREGLSLSVEAYHRRMFDMAYATGGFGFDGLWESRHHFDGEGRVWGIDLMLRRMQSRRVDGWLSYSFNWTRHRNPGRRDDWFFPSFHRFRNLNLVLNVRPAPRFNIYTRLGIASGSQLSRRIWDAPAVFPVYILGPDGGYFIERYFWPSEPDEGNRTSPSLPLDVKFSIFGGNPRGRARWEVYAAVENALGLLSSQLGLSQGNRGFDQSTGQPSRGVNAATYQIPFPIPSVGFRITF